MKKRFLHIVRFITFLVALQILNVDFFIQDVEEANFYLVSLGGDNDEPDSVIEYVAHEISNKIKGRGKSNNKPNRHLQAHKHMGLKMTELQQAKFATCEIDFKEVKASSFVKNYHYQFCKEITPPPPKA